MIINDIIWMGDIADKVIRKHQVSLDEVEEVFFNNPAFKKAQRGRYNNEHLYYAFGQSDSGRYLLVVFIYKKIRMH